MSIGNFFTIYKDRELTNRVIDTVNSYHCEGSSDFFYHGWRNPKMLLRPEGSEYIEFSLGGVVVARFLEIKGGLDNVVEIEVPYHKEFNYKGAISLNVSSFYTHNQPEEWY